MRSNDPLETPTRARGMQPIAGGTPTSALGEDSTPAGGRTPQAPMTFSDVIDLIGMGPFQNRLVIMCGMVSYPPTSIPGTC